MTGKKKIAIFIISLIGGGAERVVSILTKHLAAEFDVHLVLIENVIDYELPANQRLHVLSKGKSSNGILNILKIPVLAWKYRAYLRKHDIQLSFSFLPRPNFVAGWLKLMGWKGTVMMNERIFTSLYFNNTPFSFKSWIGRLLVKKLYPKADLIACNSQLIVEDLKNTFSVTQCKYTVIHNPIDLEAVERKLLAAKPKLPNATFTFLTLGRLDKQKNHLLLLRAFAKLNDTEICLQIAGKGALEQQLKDEIRTLGLENRVTLIAHTNNPFELLKQADCFVLSSDYEGFPNAILEALACGLPIISTDCLSGPREILAPSVPITDAITALATLDYGILTPVGDVGQMANALQMIYKDEMLRKSYSAKALNRARNFDVAHITKQFSNLLKTVV